MKNIIFTRKENIDGVGCAILAKIVYGKDCEVVFSSQETINDDFIKFFNVLPTYDDDEEIDTYNIIGNQKLYEYDNIVIADICLTDELLRRCGRAPGVISRLKYFDHHDIAFQKGVNAYSLSGLVEKSDLYGPCCSLGLFYSYLKRKRMIEAEKPLKEFVELVRVCDSGDKINATKKTEDLMLLFNALPTKDFANKMYFRVTNQNLNSFEFTEEEKKIIEKEREKQESLDKE